MKVFQIRQDDRFAWYETSKEHMEDMVNKCKWQGRVLDLDKDDSVQPMQQPAPAHAVHQFRTAGASDWYDGHPDSEDGGGPYEVRILYAAPVAAPVAVDYSDSELEKFYREFYDDSIKEFFHSQDSQSATSILMRKILSLAAPVAAPVDAPAASVQPENSRERFEAHIKERNPAASLDRHPSLRHLYALAWVNEAWIAWRRAISEQPDSGRDAAKDFAVFGISDAEAIELIETPEVNAAFHAFRESMGVTTTIKLVDAIVKAHAAHPANVAQVGELSDEQIADIADQHGAIVVCSGIGGDCSHNLDTIVPFARAIIAAAKKEA